MKWLILLPIALCLPVQPLSAGEEKFDSSVEIIQDQKHSQEFLKKSEELLNAGTPTPLKILREQLSRKNSAIELPKAKKDKPLPPTEIYARARKATVAVGSLFKCPRCIRWHMSTATAFFINEKGALITNYHVVDHADHEALFVRTGDGDVLPVREVLAADKEADLAILQVEGKGFSYLPVSPDAAVGSTVYVLSHPDSRFYTFSNGMVSRYFKSPAGATLMAITADYGKGSSGAPVMNEKGQVVGVASSTLSLYYTMEDGKKDNLQMVFKNCATAQGIMGLLSKGK